MARRRKVRVGQVIREGVRLPGPTQKINMTKLTQIRAPAAPSVTTPSSPGSKTISIKMDPRRGALISHPVPGLKAELTQPVVIEPPDVLPPEPATPSTDDSTTPTAPLPYTEDNRYYEDDDSEYYEEYPEEYYEEEITEEEIPEEVTLVKALPAVEITEPKVIKTKKSWFEAFMELFNW